MYFRIVAQIAAFCFASLLSVGCATTEKDSRVSRVIESETIMENINDPSKSKIPLERGETIVVYTKEKINLSSWNVDYVKMVVSDVNDTRIKGKIELVCCDYEPDKEEIGGHDVEIKLKDIDEIKVWVTTTKITPYAARDYEDSFGAILRLLATLWFLGELADISVNHQ